MGYYMNTSETLSIDKVPELHISNINEMMNVIADEIDRFTSANLPNNIIRHVSTTSDHSTAIVTLTFMKYRDSEFIHLENRRRIHIIMFQDIPSGNISITITNGEEHGQRIIFRCLRVDPSTSIKKYLPSIMESMVKILNVI